MEVDEVILGFLLGNVAFHCLVTEDEVEAVLGNFWA